MRNLIRRPQKTRVVIKTAHWKSLFLFRGTTWKSPAEILAAVDMLNQSWPPLSDDDSYYVDRKYKGPTFVTSMELTYLFRPGYAARPHVCINTTFDDNCLGCPELDDDFMLARDKCPKVISDGECKDLNLHDLIVAAIRDDRKISPAQSSAFNLSKGKINVHTYCRYPTYNEMEWKNQSGKSPAGILYSLEEIGAQMPWTSKEPITYSYSGRDHIQAAKLRIFYDMYPGRKTETAKKIQVCLLPGHNEWRRGVCGIFRSCSRDCSERIQNNTCPHMDIKSIHRAIFGPSR